MAKTQAMRTSVASASPPSSATTRFDSTLTPFDAMLARAAGGGRCDVLGVLGVLSLGGLVVLVAGGDLCGVWLGVVGDELMLPVPPPGAVWLDEGIGRDC